MSSRRTVVMAAIFVLLAGWFFAFEGVFVEGPAPETETAAAETLLACEGTEASRVVVGIPSLGSLEARWTGQGWAIKPVPRTKRLAEGAVADLVTALCTLPVVETIPEPGSLADFGLEEPVAEIRVALGGDETVLLVGDFTPVRNFVYLRRADDSRVRKVGALVRAELDKVVLHLRQAGES